MSYLSVYCLRCYESSITSKKLTWTPTVQYLDEREGDGGDLILEHDRARLFKVGNGIEKCFGVVGIVEESPLPAVPDEEQSPVDDVQRESILIFVLVLHFAQNLGFMTQ